MASRAKKLPKSKVVLSDEEVRLAAKFFTVSNLGQPVPPAPRTVKQIERAYFLCASAHESEGLDIGDEFRNWLKEFRGRDGYFTAEWLKERPTDLPALAEVA